MSIVNSQKSKVNSFTLIELLIAVGIIVVIAAVIVIAINPGERLAEARDSQRETHLDSIWLGIEQKIYEDRKWDCLASLPRDYFREIRGPGMADIFDCLAPDYLPSVLVDPTEGVAKTGRNITDGLVGYWSMDEGYGTTAYDLSDNENHGTLTLGSGGNTDPADAWVEGKHGGALSFDGVDDYVDAGNGDSLNISGAITISLWMKPAGLPSVFDKHWYIIGKGSGLTTDANTGAYVLSFYKVTDKLYFDTGNGTNRCGLISNKIDWENEWYHIVAVWDGTTETNSKRLYINNFLDNQKTSAISELRTDSPSLRLGYRNLNYFEGLIDDVRVYNRALSAAEVSDLYNYQYQTKYSIWQNPVTKDIALRTTAAEIRNISAGGPSPALSFDGTDDWVTLPSPSYYNADPGDALTLTAWFKGGTQPETLGCILWKEGGCKGWSIRLYNNGDVRIQFNTGAVSPSCTDMSYYSITANDQRYDDNQWHHVVGIIDRPNENMQLYIDGKNKGSVTIDNTKSGTGGSTRIGTVWNLTLFFRGLIYDPRIYNRALSAAEVSDVYKGTHITDGLVGYWPFSEMQGCAASDYSGNNNHGELKPTCPTNAPEWTAGR